jgi:hypothetical protein
MATLHPVQEKRSNEKDMKNIWVPFITDDHQYVWHYCKFCGVAMNREHKSDCPAWGQR